MFILFVSLATILYIIYALFFNKSYGIPPGPFSLPIIGYSPWIDRGNSRKTWAKLRKEYGDVFSFYEGTSLQVMVNGWQAVNEGLQNDSLNNRATRVVSRDLSNGEGLGVMTVNGHLWKTQRRFSLYHLKNLGFGKKSHEVVIQEQMTDMIQQIRSKSEPFVIQILLGVSSINILWSIVGGERFPMEDEKLAKLIDMISNIFRNGQGSLGLMYSFPFLRHIFPNISNYKTIKTGYENLINFIMDHVKQHKTSIDADSPRDFIDVFLNEIDAKDSDASFKDKQLAFLVLDLFIAGSETSTSFISFTIMYLCLYPEKQKVLQREIDEIVGTSRLPSMDDRSRLIQTDAFLHEVLRMRNPAQMGVPHCAREDTTLQGYRIPAGTIVHFNIGSVLMEEEYWGEPHEFRPERFIEDGRIKKYERMIAFGKGKRVCLGESLARMTSFLMFSALVQNFSFSFPPGQAFKNTDGIMGFTLSLPPLKVNVMDRGII